MGSAITTGIGQNLAANITGRTDGLPPSAGKIGEKIAATISTLTSITTEADITGASISLTAGCWRIEYSCTVQVNTGATSGNSTDGTVKITDNSNNLVGASARNLRCKTVAAVAGDSIVSLSASEVVNIAATTVYKLRALKTDGAGTGTVNVFSQAGLNSTFYAVRIG